MLHSSTKEKKRVDKDGEEVLTHCEKHRKDSLELTSLCKLLFFTIWVAMLVLLLGYSSGYKAVLIVKTRRSNSQLHMQVTS